MRRLCTFSVFFADQIFGHFFARHTTGADANASIHIFGRRKNTFDFDLSRFFSSFRREIQPFVFVDLTFLFQIFETLLFPLFLLFQIFFVVRTMSSARKEQMKKKYMRKLFKKCRPTSGALFTYFVDGNTSFRTTRSFSSVKEVLLRF